MVLSTTTAFQLGLHIGFGLGSHGANTQATLQAMDPVMVEPRPAWVFVHGGAKSTTTGTLSALNLHLPLAYLEATPT